MLKWVIMAAGAALTIWGYWWGWTGWSIVEVERGWSAVISGAMVFAAGVVTLAIGLGCWHIERIAGQMRAALDRVQSSAAGSAQLPIQPSASPQDLTLAGSTMVSAASAGVPHAMPEAEPSASENQLDLPLAGPASAQGEPPSADTPAQPVGQSEDMIAANDKPKLSAVDDRSGPDTSAEKAEEADVEKAAPNLADNDSSISGPQTRAPHDGAPEGLRMSFGRPRVPTQLRVIAGDGPDADAPAAPQTVDAAAHKAIEIELEKVAEPMAQASAEAATAPQDQVAAAPPPPMPLRPIPPLAPPPARADWPAPPAGAIPPLAGAPLAPPRMPAAAVPPVLTPQVAEPVAAPHAPQSALDRFLEEFDIAPPDGVPASRPEAKAEAPAGTGVAAEAATEGVPETAPVPDAAAASDAQTGSGTGSSAAGSVDAPSIPQPPVPSSPEPESEPPDTAAMEATEDKSEQPQPESPESHAREEQPVASVPPVDTRTLVREYESQGIKYYLFDDGSVDAHAPTGIFRFASLEELRAYIEERNR